MFKTGTCKLESRGYSHGSLMELIDKETEEYVVPGSITLRFHGEPLRYTQVDSHGNPQIGGVACTLLHWKVRQLVRDGVLESEYDINVDYSYETTPDPIFFPTSQRLPQPDICPVCGHPITPTDLDIPQIITNGTPPGPVYAESHCRVDTICRGLIVVHEPCAREYQRLNMIDDIAERVELAFNSIEIDREDRLSWGIGPKGIWYELIPNEYSSHEAYAHRPWFLFHTPLGDIKIGWRKRVINITFMTNFAAFDMDIFKDENATKAVRGGERTIHAWGYDKLFDYLTEVYKAILSNQKHT